LNFAGVGKVKPRQAEACPSVALPLAATSFQKTRSFRFATSARLLQSRVCKSSFETCVAVEMLSKRFFVSGGVQGVGFRFFVERASASLGVKGYVRNRMDGRVEVYAIGSAVQMDALRHALRRGPRMASVQNVEELDAGFEREFANEFSIEGDE
jgi:acylphosphatase